MSTVGRGRHRQRKPTSRWSSTSTPVQKKGERKALPRSIPKNRQWKIKVEQCLHPPQYQEHRANAVLSWIRCGKCGGRWGVPSAQERANAAALNAVRAITPAGYGQPSQSSGTSSTPSAAAASPTTPSPTTPSEGSSTPLHPGNSEIPAPIPHLWRQQAVRNMRKLTDQQRNQLETMYCTLRQSNTAQRTMELMQNKARDGQEVDTIYQFCLVKADAEVSGSSSE